MSPAPSSVGPPIDVDALVAATVEGILYGFSLLMFGLTLWVLTRRKAPRDYNILMITVAVLLLIFSTMHMIADIDRIYTGFITLRASGETLTFFGDTSQKTFVFKSSVYAFQTVLGDSVVIYRAYVVWQSVWPILLPLLILGGVIATGVGAVLFAALATVGSPLPIFERSERWSTSFFASTFACNLTGTLLLAFRLWTLDRRLRNIRSGAGSLMPTLLICVDSGLLYSITLMSTLITLVRGSRAQFILLDLISPIISISFYAIILRVAVVAARNDRERLKSLVPISRFEAAQGHGAYSTSYSSHQHSGILPDSDAYPLATLHPPSSTLNISKEEMDGKQSTFR